MSEADEVKQDAWTLALKYHGSMIPGGYRREEIGGHTYSIHQPASGSVRIFFDGALVDIAPDPKP